MSLSQTEALQMAVRTDIQENNGIDMSKTVPLGDLGIELISCYSAIPNLVENYKKSEPEKLKKKVRFCSNCGAKLDDNSSFCAECGTKTE